MFLAKLCTARAFERVERVARADPYLLNVTGSQSQGKFKVTLRPAEIVRIKRCTGEGEARGRNEGKYEAEGVEGNSVRSNTP